MLSISKRPISLFSSFWCFGCWIYLIRTLRVVAFECGRAGDATTIQALRKRFHGRQLHLENYMVGAGAAIKYDRFNTNIVDSTLILS